jgi:hypothetical protein
MKYMLLIYNDSTLLDALPAGRADAMMRDCLSHADELRQDGHLEESQMLEGAETAKSVRIRNGRMTADRWAIHRDQGSSGGLQPHRGQGHG